TVPGAPAAWAELSERFGKLPFKEVLQPAITYAEEGFPVSIILSKYWQRAFQIFKKQLKGKEFDHWFMTFAPKGRAPLPGEIWSSPYHARTLRLLAETNSESFYTGEIADEIASFSKEYGGFITKDDLAANQPE